MSSEEGIESELESWRPRDILRRTNWLYRVDALRNYDIREMSVLWKLTELYRDYATQFLIWAYAIRLILLSTVDESTKERLEKTFKMIIQMTEIFWSEGYCYLLDFVSIAYYPVTNRFTSAHNGPRFPEESRQTIDTLGNSEAKSLTGLSVNQLKRMFRQFPWGSVRCQFGNMLSSHVVGAPPVGSKWARIICQICLKTSGF